MSAMLQQFKALGIAGTAMLLSHSDAQVAAIKGMRSDGDPRTTIERFAYRFARGVEDAGNPYTDTPNIPLFAEQLEHLYAEIQREEYIDLPMANGDILPFDTEVPAHVNIWRYRTLQSAGAAKIGNLTAVGSIPRVSVGGREYVGYVASVVNAFGFSLTDMRAMVAVGGELESMYAEAARRAHDEIQDRVAWWGDKQHKLHGFISHPNIPKVYAPVGTGNSTLWSIKDFDEVFADVVYILNAAKQRTFGREIPNLLLLPRDVETIFVTKRIENDKQTLKAHIAENFPEVTIKFVDQLNASHPDNTAGVGIAVALRVDKKAAAIVTPQIFEMLDPQWHGMEWITVCHSRIAGVKVSRPLSATIMPGISA